MTRETDAWLSVLEMRLEAAGSMVVGTQRIAVGDPDRVLHIQGDHSEHDLTSRYRYSLCGVRIALGAQVMTSGLHVLDLLQERPKNLCWSCLRKWMPREQGKD